MSSQGQAGRGRGHRPNRGGRGGGHGGGGRGHGGRGGRGGFRGGNGGDAPPAAMNDPSLDPQLAPRPPHPGYFQPSFIENPWYDLERKHGIPHLKAISSSQQPQHDTPSAHQEPAEEEAIPQQSDAAAT